MSRAKDKVVIVTGAARNMGFHAAAGLVRRGARVVIVGRDQNQLDEAREQLGGDVLAIAAKVSDPEQVQAVIDRTVSHFGGVDGIVNNAGVAFPNLVEKLKDDEAMEQVQANFLASVYTCRAIIPHLRARGGGRIVNVSSATVHVTGAFSHLSIYGATKAALELFTRDLRDEVQKDNIAVTCFIPGDTGTGFGGGWDPAAVQAAYEHWMEQGPYWNGLMEVQDVGEEIAHQFDLPPNMAYEFLMVRPVGLMPKQLEGQ